ncbi:MULTISPECIES: DUF4012 domain-containing protein [unclassified Streptomyces]|uniref:DUF4012 domain-containing protein n=1 Tax=unclassified Streptomyces TaxID=2593676 RepID=UPI002254531E|nr:MULTISPECIES: DUF4012 domain-containing protein [unclassified Streptomyces]MCX5054008.1 DUF4012 domain-containing protein [Streptomyces sp. NBC_00474]MCX5060166.1 DUF4012 domain-containing protein [Streptomyces sp. NBC_00452]MCX5252055.1 DUF4012 domain-containing protein [Streptomyces sp. NBC_00201]
MLLAAAAVPAAAAAWIGGTGVLAHRELLAAQADLNALRESVAASAGSHPTEAVAAGAPAESKPERLVRSAAEHAAKAHSLTTGPAWYTAAHLPFAGSPLETVRGIAAASDRLAGDVLPPLVRAVPRFSAGARAGGIPHVLTELEGQASAFTRAAHIAAEVRDDVHHLPESTWLPAADRAEAQLTDRLDRLVPQTRDVAVAARVVPSMLGSHGQRRYILAFQNTAEARGTGGLPGAFAVLRADRGRLSFEHFGNNIEMDGSHADIDLGAEFRAQYGNNGPQSLWANSNMSPHFPYAARIWTADWHSHSGQRLDGAIAIDPGALGLLLRAAGPARLPDGTSLTADNAVDVTERAAYAKYDDVAQRKAYFAEAARAAAGRLMQATDDPHLIPALLGAVHEVQREGRLQVWSAHKGEQRLLESRPFSGALPDSPGPFAGLVVNNAAGTKLDYYLDRSIIWAPGACTDDGRSVTATVTLTNRAPSSGLPHYVTQRVDTPPYRTHPGDNRLLVTYYAGTGASLTRATLDGHPVEMIPGAERGHPAYTVDLELPRQSSRTLVLHLREPEADRAPTIWRQALVTPLRSTVRPAAACHR